MVDATLMERLTALRASLRRALALDGAAWVVLLLLSAVTVSIGLDWLIRLTAWRHPAFRARLGEQNFTAQIKIGDDTAGRYYSFQNGVFSSHAGIHPEPDVCLSFKSQTIAV